MMADADQKLEASIGLMLRCGVILASIVVFAGGVLYLRSDPQPRSAYQSFHLEPKSLRTVTGVLHGVMHLDPASITQFGILLLIATPVLRVVFCVVGFAAQRDRIYTAVSSMVLLILLYSFIHTLK